MNASAIDRRQFLKSGAIATTLAAAGRLPLLAAEAQLGPAADASSGPYAVKPIRAYLPRFAPVDGPLRDRTRYALTYEIIHWGGGNWQAGRATNSVVGRVLVQRRPAGDAAAYTVAQETTIGGVKNFIEAQITCNADDWNSLREWKVRFYSHQPRGGVDPLSELRETGRCRKGRIDIDSGNYRYGYSARHAVVTQWTVLDFLIRKADPAVNAAFDLLQDLSLFKPSQTLGYDGETRVQVKGDRAVTLQTYAQTGEGILPIHYLLDDQGRPQLVTSSILSWALSAVT